MMLALLFVVLWLEARLCSGWSCEGSALVCQAVVAAGEEREERIRYELLVSLSQEVQEDAHPETAPQMQIAVLVSATPPPPTNV